MKLRRLLGLDRKPKRVQCDVCRHPAHYADASPRLCWQHLNDYMDARNGATTVEEYPVDVLLSTPHRGRHR